jgi:hypothetical protein
MSEKKQSSAVDLDGQNISMTSIQDGEAEMLTSEDMLNQSGLF